MPIPKSNNHKMKLLIALLLACSVNTYSQNVTYNLFIKDPCSKTVKGSNLFYLAKGSETIHPKDSTGTIVLTEPGRYRLVPLFGASSHNIYLKSGVNRDTLTMKAIKTCSDLNSKPRFIGYCRCGKRIDGYQEDRYNNGNLRIAGKFKNGVPVNKLTFYNTNGKIEEIRFYNKNGILEQRNKIKSAVVGKTK